MLDLNLVLRLRVRRILFSGRLKRRCLEGSSRVFGSLGGFAKGQGLELEAKVCILLYIQRLKIMKCLDYYYVPSLKLRA